MSKPNAVIMSIKGNYAVALTRDRRFIRIPANESYRIGQKLHLEKHNNKILVFSWQATAAAAMAVVIILAAGIFFPYNQLRADAYLSLGLNSSGAELWVGPDNKVIRAEFTGNKAILNQVKIKGLNVYQAVTEITNEARKAGLLKDNDRDNLLLLNYANLSEKGGQQLKEFKIKQSVEAGLKDTKSHSVIMVNKNDRHYISKASEMGLTATQYFVLEASRASGHEVTADQIKHGRIRAVLQKAGTTPEELFEPEATRTYVNSTHENPARSSMSSHQIYIDPTGADALQKSKTNTSTGTGTGRDSGMAAGTGTDTGSGYRSSYMDSGQADSHPETYLTHDHHADEMGSFDAGHQFTSAH